MTSEQARGEAREVYLRELEERLDRRAVEIESLKVQAEGTEGSRREALLGRIAVLEEKQAELRARAGGVRSAVAWNEVKDRVEEGWDKLSTAFDDVAARIHK